MAKQKFTSKIIGDIRNMISDIEKTIHTITDDASYMTMCRRPLNLLLIQAVTGGEIDQNKKGEFTIHFNHRVPTMAEMSELVGILSDYIVRIETPYFDQMQKDDDMAISNVITGANIMAQTKVKKKDFKESIMSPHGYSASLLNISDLMAISATADDLRKRMNRNKYLIIGGITIIAATTAVVGSVMAYKHFHKKDEDIDSQNDIDLNESDVQLVDLDDPDVPMVSLDG